MDAADAVVAVGSLAVVEWFYIVTQVFGGCCCNVFLLERLILNNVSEEHSLGTLITFSQFLVVAFFSYWPQLDFLNSNWKRLYLKKSAIPIEKWLISVVLFFSVSLLNNMVWKFNITVPVHIIFRSCGTIITMVVGYCFGGKTYSPGQCVSSIVITLGCILGTLPDSTEGSQSINLSESKVRFLFGLFILVLACFLSAFMGLYNEKLFKQYGNHWQESLFYLHFFGLPLFLIVSPTIYKEFKAIWTSADQRQLLGSITVSQQFLDLTLNVITQFICIRGVSMLAGSTLALTVTITLLVRKFASLFISILYFGNHISRKAILGACGVFLGALMYCITNRRHLVRSLPLKKTQ